MLCPFLPLILPKPPPPIPSGGTPMDMDTVQKTCSLPPHGCYQCREANHLVRDCSYHLDVRRLTIEQREELIKDLMALKDAVEEEKVCSTLEEDFA